jgi:hypothetical protein
LLLLFHFRPFVVLSLVCGVFLDFLSLSLSLSMWYENDTEVNTLPPDIFTVKPELADDKLTPTTSPTVATNPITPLRSFAVGISIPPSQLFDSRLSPVSPTFMAPPSSSAPPVLSVQPRTRFSPQFTRPGTDASQLPDKFSSIQLVANHEYQPEPEHDEDRRDSQSNIISLPPLPATSPLRSSSEPEMFMLDLDNNNNNNNTNANSATASTATPVPPLRTSKSNSNVNDTAWHHLDISIVNARQQLIDFLKMCNCYDLMPSSGKIVVLDVQLPVKAAMQALDENKVRYQCVCVCVC